MINFILGIFVGATIGFFLFCCLAVSKQADERKNKEVKRG